MLPQYNLHNRIWNTNFWNVLYDSAFSWKPSNKEKIKRFLENFFVPCETCQAHYQQYLLDFPIDINWRVQNIVEWVFTLHNNIRSSKQMALLSWEYTLEMYERHHNNSIIYFSLDGTTCESC